MNGEIDKLIKFIAENFKFNEENYPELKGASDEERLIFAIRHSGLHFAKTAGKIATVSEDADHGENLDIDKLKADIAKSMINSLRLAELVNMSEDELTESIEHIIKDQND